MIMVQQTTFAVILVPHLKSLQHLYMYRTKLTLVLSYSWHCCKGKYFKIILLFEKPWRATVPLLLNRKRQRIRSEGRERNQLQWSRTAGTEPAWPGRRTNAYKRERSSRRIPSLGFSLQQHSVALKWSLPLAHRHLGGSVPMACWFLQF